MDLDISADGPKMVRETLCLAQSAVAHSGDSRAQEHVERLGRLIKECDRHRPLGQDGKHGNRHTATCGCEREEQHGDLPHHIQAARSRRTSSN